MSSDPILPVSIVCRIERMLVEGKPVERELLVRYQEQTGRPIPPAAPPAVTRAASHVRRSRTSNAAILGGQSRGFVKLQRSVVTEELMKDAPAFLLLTQIALRARWSREPGLNNLSFGEALVGDSRAIGLTEKAYRLAKARLAKWRLADFRGSSKGTIATLLDDRIYAIEDARKPAKSGGQRGDLSPVEDLQNGADIAADEGRTKGGRGATKKTGKTGKDGEEDTLSRACWPEELPLTEAEEIANTYARPVARVHEWYSRWVARKQEFGDPLPSSPAQAYARFKAAVRADRNRPLPKGKAMGWADPVRPPPRWATDDDKPRERSPYEI